MNVSIILSTEWWAVHVHIIWYNLLHIEDHKSLAGTAQFSRSYLVCFKENKDPCTDKLIHFYAIHTWSVTCYNVFYCHSDNSSSFLQVLKLTYTQSISIRRREGNRTLRLPVISCLFYFRSNDAFLGWNIDNIHDIYHNVYEYMISVHHLIHNSSLSPWSQPASSVLFIAPKKTNHSVSIS